MHPLLRPKHIAISCVILLVSLGIGIGSVQAMEAPELPATFQTPALHIGDRWAYQFERGGDSDTIVWSHEVHPVQEFRNGTHGMEVVPIRSGVDDGRGPVRPYGTLWQPNVNRVVATFGAGNESWIGGPVPGVNQPGSRGYMRTTFIEQPQHTYNDPGFHPWQGQAAGLHVDEFMGSTGWKIIGAAEVNGTRYVEVDARTDSFYNERVRMVLSERIPVPISIRWYYEEFGVDSEVGVRAWTLTGFSAGSEEIETTPPEAFDLPAAELAAATPWLIDLRGVDMDFTLEEADAAARADRELGPWFDARPDAIVQQASASTRAELPLDDVRKWLVAWVSDDERLVAWIEQRQAIVEGLPEQAVVTWWKTEPYEKEFEAVAPGVTGRSAVDIYEAWAGAEPNAIGVSLQEFPVVDGIVTYSVMVGQEEASPYRYDGGVQGLESYSFALTLDHTGRPTATSESFLESEFDVSGVPTNHPESEPLDAAPQGIDPSLLTTAASLAFLAAVLYYLSPLLRSGGLALFSRIRPDVALQHPVRQQIMETVGSEPGIHFAAVRERLELANGVAQHHVRRLQDTGHIVGLRQGGRLHFYPKGKHDHGAIAREALLSGTTKLVYEEAHGLGSSAIARAVGVSPSTAHHHLRKLVDAGLVTKEGRTYSRNE